MRKDTGLLSATAILMAGAAAAGLIAARRKTHAATLPPDAKSLDELRGRMAELEAATERRLGEIETRLAEQAARLAERPTTEQIAGVMEKLLARTMASLDERLTVQSQSIDVLKNTVSESDGLLKRVLESLDALQPYSEPDAPEEPLRPS